MTLSSVFCVLLLGVLEGITEWLPVSSTGHLLLLGDRLPLSMRPEFRELFDVAIQLGAILAVLILYRRELNPFSRNDDTSRRLWGRILLAVLPSAAVGLLLEDWIYAYLFNSVTVALALILWGIALMLSERSLKKKAPAVRSPEELSCKRASVIGLWQTLSLIPGTSRSGATILGAQLVGCSRECAARFSFFLAIPTMLGASLLKGVGFLSEGNLPTSEEVILLSLGASVAFLVSLVSLRFLTDYVRRHGFFAFGVYRILLGSLVLFDRFF